MVNKMYKYFIVGMILLLLLCCCSCQQVKPVKEEKTNEIDVLKSETTAVMENIKLKTKLQFEYRKKFGASITRTELSIMNVYYGVSRGRCHCCDVSITRVATGGAIARYSSCISKTMVLELSIGEWITFVNSLYKLRIHEWDKARREMYDDGRIYFCRPDGTWQLKIFFLDSSKYEDQPEYCEECLEMREFGDCHNTAWPNWKEFNDLIFSMAERIIADGKEID
jgi:hypothetical protein